MLTLVFFWVFAALVSGFAAYLRFEDHSYRMGVLYLLAVTCQVFSAVHAYRTWRKYR